MRRKRNKSELHNINAAGPLAASKFSAHTLLIFGNAKMRTESHTFPQICNKFQRKLVCKKINFFKISI